MSVFGRESVLSTQFLEQEELLSGEIGQPSFILRDPEEVIVECDHTDGAKKVVFLYEAFLH
jgi:hypothetical protein